MTLTEIRRALRKTLQEHVQGGHGYYGDGPDDAGGWIDCGIEFLEDALFNAGWTPPNEESP